MKINEKGFSLIEIIIVIAILGFLASVTIISFKPQEIFANGRNSKRLSDVHAINTAISQWMSREASNDGDPYTTLGINQEGIQAITPQDGSIDGEGIPATSLSALSGPAYLPTIPNDPDGTSNYIVGINNLDNPNHILVCTDQIEFSSTYPESDYPNAIFCLSN